MAEAVGRSSLTVFMTRVPPLMGVPLHKRLLVEAIGVALIVFFGPGSAVISAHQNGAITHEGIAAANGLIIVVLIYAAGHVSGAHFNPGVTLSFAAFRHFHPRDVVPYWLAQFAGGIAGAALLRALFGDALESAVTHPSTGDADAFVVEVVLTFLLMFVIMAVATDVRAAGQAAALAIGIAVGLDVLVGGPISSGSMNPARSFGPALVSGKLSDVWIYFIAPPLGALLGAAVYTFVRSDDDAP